MPAPSQHLGFSTAAATSGTSTNFTVTATTAGRLLIACTSIEGASATTPTITNITDNSSGGSNGNWLRVNATDRAFNSSRGRCNIFYVPNAASITQFTLVASASGLTYCIDFFEFAVSPAFSLLDQDADNGGATTTPSSGATAGLTQLSELAVGFITEAQQGSAITGPASPWTNETQLNSNVTSQTLCMLSGYNNPTDGSAQTYSGSTSVSHTWAAFVATWGQQLAPKPLVIQQAVKRSSFW